MEAFRDGSNLISMVLNSSFEDGTPATMCPACGNKGTHKSTFTWDVVKDNTRDVIKHFHFKEYVCSKCKWEWCEEVVE